MNNKMYSFIATSMNILLLKIIYIIISYIIRHEKDFRNQSHIKLTEIIFQNSFKISEDCLKPRGKLLT